MNEIITENTTEIVEPIVTATAKAGNKNVVIGFAAGVLAGIGGTRLIKAGCNKLAARKERKAESRKHRVPAYEEDDNDIIDITTEQ